MVRTMCAECFAKLRQTSVQPRKALSIAHDGDRCTGCNRQSDYVVGYLSAAGEWRIEQW